MFPVLPTPNDEILKLEALLDKLEPQFPPLLVTDDNPIDIDHFKLLDAIHESETGALDDVKLVRHYLNALRQFVAGERFSLKQKQVIDEVRKKAEVVKVKLDEVLDGNKQEPPSSD